MTKSAPSQVSRRRGYRQVPDSWPGVQRCRTMSQPTEFENQTFHSNEIAIDKSFMIYGQSLGGYAPPATAGVGSQSLWRNLTPNGE